MLAMSYYIWLFDIKDNIRLSCVDFIIRFKIVDFTTFESFSDFYEI